MSLRKSTGSDESRLPQATRFGRFGESAAARWYEQAGYHILQRNWRCQGAEIDLIVAKGNVVVFVEVKARSGVWYGTGAEAVDARKQRRLRSAAGQWLQQYGTGTVEVRFDVVDVDRRGRLLFHHDCLA